MDSTQEGISSSQLPGRGESIHNTRTKDQEDKRALCEEGHMDLTRERSCREKAASEVGLGECHFFKNYLFSAVLGL